MQAHTDTLAILECGTQEGLASFIDNLIDSYTGQEYDGTVATPTQSVQSTERPPILDDLAEILNIRGRLQQMGATFDLSGALLTYGNPESTSDFESMLKLGPLYEEQWSTFFIERHVPRADESMQSNLRTLKKMLENEGVVFGKAGQWYSFGDSNAKLRRLCCAYDKLWVEWRNLKRTEELSVQKGNDGDDEASVVTDRQPVQDHDSGFVDGIVQEGGVVIKPLDITGRVCQQLPSRNSSSSGIPQNIGWRFSTDLSNLPLSNQWRFSDNLEAVPVWNHVERVAVATRTVLPTTSNTQSIVGELALLKLPPIHEIGDYSVTSGVSSAQHVPVTSLLDLREVLAEGPQVGDAQMASSAEATSVSIVVDEPEDHDGKKGGKLRRWFRHALGWN